MHGCFLLPVDHGDLKRACTLHASVLSLQLCLQLFCGMNRATNKTGPERRRRICRKETRPGESCLLRQGRKL